MQALPFPFSPDNPVKWLFMPRFKFHAIFALQNDLFVQAYPTIPTQAT